MSLSYYVHPEYHQYKEKMDRITLWLLKHKKINPRDDKQAGSATFRFIVDRFIEYIDDDGQTEEEA
jgi:hypothetical protein